MATLQEILARAQALREETELGSISPERAGSIMYDTLQQINQMQLLGASLVINKIYASVAAMEADSAPVSDLSGTALKEGQLAVIVPSDTSSSDLGSVYRYNGTTDGVSSWSFVGKIGGYPMDETPTEGSTRAVTSGGVYSEVSQLSQNLTEQINELDGKVEKSASVGNGYEIQNPITPTHSPLSIIDENGYVLAKLGQNGLKTKYYDSQKNARVFNDSTDYDLAIVDEDGYAIMVFKDGVARTKNTNEGDGTQWNGKKWYAYGTSITNINNEGKYPNYLRDLSGMLLTNKGISGGGIGNNLGGYSRGQVKTALMNITDGKLEADLITLETGANDVGPDTPLGTIYDTGDDTLAGCLNQCLRYLQENTTAQIVVFPSPAYNSSEFDAHYHEWQLLIRDICFINKVYFIDGENGMGWAKLHSSQRTLYIVDTIHQTDLGGSLFAQSIWGQLKNIPLFATSLT